MNNIYIKCPDGFVNQLRLSLAANILVKRQVAKKASQEWVINNHNVVDYNKFFNPLPYLIFEKIEENDVIVTESFKSMTRALTKDNNIVEIFNESYADLKIRENYKNLFEKFIKENQIDQCVGVHLRTGCKAALLAECKNRSQLLPHDEIIDILKLKKEKIYLATDNAETQNKFLDIFKERILFFKKINEGVEKFNLKYDRNLVKRYTSDLHVVADFYLLQKCKNFIGSNESSFSIMIQFIRNNKEDYPLKGTL